ncbi:MAG: septum site-determining protein MinD [Candidatus Poribacteria bacterium]|jgi:septum site-determining protein MinD|nr:septum site-determining protein MinD [Candidatus Poribacteria bacterium]MDP6748693.1 septum site-determining protein MinD [Candidatus Poribacteria bacterium]MDP6996360.1 septum site-determining protein MinD [Candidatus Poribacteria bacterium]
MGKVIVITSGKGGVGKSTSVANIGTALAMLGKSVVVVDADIGLRNLDIIMGLESRVVYNSMDVIDGSCELEKALVTDRRVENLKLLAASQRNNKTDVQPEQMKDVCLKLRETHDYVLIDSPAGIEQGFENASSAAEAALIVTTPDVSAVRDADRIIGLLQAKEVSDLQLIINRFAPNMVKKGDMLNQYDVLDVLSIKLIGIVPEDPSIVGSSNRGLPLIYDATSEAAGAYKRIARRLDGQDVPVPEFKAIGWFSNMFGKLFGLD